jgi:magnesium transporter
MIRLYTRLSNTFNQVVHDCEEEISDNPIWIDLINVTPKEEERVESYLGIDIPTAEELKQIEISQRLYQSHGALYMTAIVVANAETTMPESQSVTFVLYKNYLITVRYSSLRTFKTFSTHITKNQPEGICDAHSVFTGLMDATINRIGDILEAARKNIDNAADIVFHASEETVGNKVHMVNYKDVMKKIGCNGRLISKARESLVSLDRVISYAVQSNILNLNNEIKSQLHVLLKDIASLSDYAHFLSNETTFLLDATLGMINIEQNKIIKIMSVMASIFLPPTLIAKTRMVLTGKFILEKNLQ